MDREATDMKLPASIEIFGEMYVVVRQKHWDVYAEADGSHHPELHEIIIDDKLEGDELVHTFLHELFHGILDSTCINEGLHEDLEEAIVESISKYLVQNFDIKLKP